MNETPELAPTTDTRREAARNAVLGLREAGRMQNGLAARELLYANVDVAEWHAEQTAAIAADLGGDSELTAMQRANVREAARLDLLLDALGYDLLTNGTLTAKGKRRAALTGYLQVLDRFLKVSGTLGLQRIAKPVNPLDAVRDAVARANEESSE